MTARGRVPKHPGAFICAVFLFVAVAAHPNVAAALSFNLGNTFSGTIPSGSPPWGTVTIADNGTDSVLVTMMANLQSASEFISEWSLNITPDSPFPALSFTYDNVNSTGPQATKVAEGTDCCQADGDGKFDIEFQFPSKAGSRFEGTEKVIYTITCTSCAGDIFTENSFNASSSPGGANGTFHSAMHVQGIATNPPGSCVKVDGTTDIDQENCSGWIGDGSKPPQEVPEPGSLLAAGSTLVALGALAWRRSRRKPR